MSVASADLILYAAQNICSDDTGPSGGSIDTTHRATFNQLTANTALTYISDGPDARTVTAVGRDATGAVVTETITLSDNNLVRGSQVFERLQRVDVNSADGSRFISISQLTDDNSVGNIPPNELGFFGFFSNSASGQSSTSRYEKCFFINSNASSTLSSATATLLVDPSSRIAIGLESAVNGSGATANRLTAPSPVTFAGVGVAQSVPGNQLTAGQAIGIWIRLTLQANDTPQRASFSTQLSGTSV